MFKKIFQLCGKGQMKHLFSHFVRSVLLDIWLRAQPSAKYSRFFVRQKISTQKNGGKLVSNRGWVRYLSSGGTQNFCYCSMTHFPRCASLKNK
ncbi:Uncharacterized protein APZ42_020772 [Daphnia magna]|uniref:Uncharacterized protein n=1 Tax=Daphnia magna TaxID=35525 RepID=A0A164XDC2_9CRUS|nr:Uncharacterized protein APZ42_020772 [Daphnia magna]